MGIVKFLEYFGARLFASLLLLREKMNGVSAWKNKAGWWQKALYTTFCSASFSSLSSVALRAARLASSSGLAGFAAAECAGAEGPDEGADKGADEGVTATAAAATLDSLS